MLSIEQLLAASLDREKVELLGDFVWVRGMTGTERDSWEYAVSFHQKKSPTGAYDHFRASLVVRTLCDESGVRLCTEKDIPKISQMPAKDLDKLYSVGARLSGVTKEDAEQLGKNSETGQSEDSISS